jgi:hypothetical protein
MRLVLCLVLLSNHVEGFNYGSQNNLTYATAYEIAKNSPSQTGLASCRADPVLPT